MIAVGYLFHLLYIWGVGVYCSFTLESEITCISLSIISKKAAGVSCDNVVPYMFNSGCTGCAHNFVLNVPPTIQKLCSTTILLYKYFSKTMLLQILCNSVLQCLVSTSLNSTSHGLELYWKTKSELTEACVSVPTKMSALSNDILSLLALEFERNIERWNLATLANFRKGFRSHIQHLKKMIVTPSLPILITILVLPRQKGPLINYSQLTQKKHAKSNIFIQVLCVSIADRWLTTET